MLKFEGVKKHYEDFELDLTLEVPEGYVTGLIGVNYVASASTGVAGKIELAHEKLPYMIHGTGDQCRRHGMPRRAGRTILPGLTALIQQHSSTCRRNQTSSHSFDN